MYAAARASPPEGPPNAGLTLSIRTRSSRIAVTRSPVWPLVGIVGTAVSILVKPSLLGVTQPAVKAARLGRPLPRRHQRPIGGRMAASTTAPLRPGELFPATTWRSLVPMHVRGPKSEAWYENVAHLSERGSVGFRCLRSQSPRHRHARARSSGRGTGPPRRRSREHKIPWFQGDSSCDVCDQRRNVEDEQARSRVLKDLAVQPLDDSQIRGISRFRQVRALPGRTCRSPCHETIVRPRTVRRVLTHR